MAISKVKVMLVDDYEGIRQGVKVMFRKAESIEIYKEADSGKKALEILNDCSHEIDIVVMDIIMVNIDGIETTRVIHEKFPNINVLAFSMLDDDMVLKKMIQNGALGYVLKTAARTELEEAILTVAKGHVYFNKQTTDYITKFMTSQNISKWVRSKTELTQSEQEVLKMIIEEYTDHEIAEALRLSTSRVNKQRANILQKLDTKNRTDLVKQAIRMEV